MNPLIPPGNFTDHEEVVIPTQEELEWLEYLETRMKICFEILEEFYYYPTPPHLKGTESYAISRRKAEHDFRRFIQLRDELNGFLNCVEPPSNYLHTLELTNVLGGDN